MVKRNGWGIAWLIALVPLVALASPPQLTREQLSILLMLLGDDGPAAVTAGGDTVAVGSTNVVVRGDVSGTGYDPVWSQIGGPIVQIANPDRPRLEFTAPAVAVPTELTFEITAQDGEGGVISDQVAVTVYPNQAPEVTVQFPCDGCRAYGTTLSFRGVANNNGDDPVVAEMDSVTLTIDLGHGPVNLPIDSEGNWEALDLPLPAGVANASATLTATDAFGAVTINNLTIPLAPTWTNPVAAFDALTQNIVYALEGTLIQRVTRLDLTTGVFTTLFENRGLPFVEQVFDMEADPDGSRLILGELHSGRLLAFNFANNQFSTVSATGVGTGPSIDSIWQLAIDTDDRLVAVYDTTNQSLFSIDLDSGDRALLEDSLAQDVLAVDSVGDEAHLIDGTLATVTLDTGNLTTVGTTLSLETSMDYDPNIGFLAVISFLADTVWWVNPANGQVFTLSAPGTSGVEFGSPRQIIKDPFANRFMVNDYQDSFGANDTNTLVAVSDIGTRQTIQNGGLGSGQILSGSAVLAQSSDENTLFTANFQSQSIFSIPSDGHDRTLVSGPGMGVGPALAGPMDMAQLDANRLAVVDTALDAVLSVNLNTGDRIVLSGAGVGSGPAIDNPRTMAVDSTNALGYVANETNGEIVVVDLITGVRTLLTDNSDDGLDIVEPTGVDLDSNNQRLLVADSGDGSTASIQLVAVDLASGEKQIMSSQAVGSGPTLLGMRDVVLTSPNVALVAGDDQIVVVDLTNGDRTVVADDNTGQGEVITNIQHLQYQTEANRIRYWSATFGAAFELDVASGDRVVKAR